MWSFMNGGPAMALLDFTNDLSVLLLGLVGVVGWSGAMIIWMAVRSSRLQPRQPAIVKQPLADDQQDAA